jgi:hypothetical protein
MSDPAAASVTGSADNGKARAAAAAISAIWPRTRITALFLIGLNVTLVSDGRAQARRRIVVMWFWPGQRWIRLMTTSTERFDELISQPATPHGPPAIRHPAYVQHGMKGSDHRE